MSLTSLIHESRPFRDLLDRLVPEGWYKEARRDLPALEPKDALPGVLSPVQAGVVCDFAITKLFRDGGIACTLVPYSESGQVEAEKTGEKEFVVRLAAETFAKGVWLRLDGQEAEFSDNFFDMLPEVPVSVQVRTDDGLETEDLRRRLRIRSLAEARYGRP